MSRKMTEPKPETPAKKDWSKPIAVDEVTMVFPAGIVGTFLPVWDEVPAEFKDDTTQSRKWRQFQRDWFFSGLESADGLVAKPGIDKQTALRHLNACQRSYQPKHEHKEAGVAYLASLWFEESSTWKKGNGP